jgi:hypothetical protein
MKGPRAAPLPRACAENQITVRNQIYPDSAGSSSLARARDVTLLRVILWWLDIRRKPYAGGRRRAV